MTKEQAIAAMKKGEKITHYYFADDEWISMRLNGSLVTEEGYEVEPREFWKWRTDEGWNDGYEIYKEGTE